MTNKDPIVIGRAERVNFPELQCSDVPARIDTGAKTSALWASSVAEQDGTLQVVLFGDGNEFFTGQTVRFTEYATTVVASSNGQAEERFKVRLLVQLGGKKIRAWFTLADRSTQAYPVLIGRNVLRGKFIVDVKQGKVLYDAERRRTAELRSVVEKPESEEKV